MYIILSSKHKYTKWAHMACSHVCHMSCMYHVSWYQFSGHNLPLQESSGVAFLVSLQECGFFLHITMHRVTNSGKPQVKISIVFSKGNRFAARWTYKTYINKTYIKLILKCLLSGANLFTRKVNISNLSNAGRSLTLDSDLSTCWAVQQGLCQDYFPVWFLKYLFPKRKQQSCRWINFLKRQLSLCFTKTRTGAVLGQRRNSTPLSQLVAGKQWFQECLLSRLVSL